ncbi:unnamed protein product [Caenorhabditis angaria]|uniref:Uncharacterized protein n=1 Tax=Caenorhabditis angaria TaxID=860376 RepID=A0A9P1IHL3_9PELO|nr:unnamed protein product [Caenorhabditis angaria]
MGAQPSTEENGNNSNNNRVNINDSKISSMNQEVDRSAYYRLPIKNEQAQIQSMKSVRKKSEERMMNEEGSNSPDSENEDSPETESDTDIISKLRIDNSFEASRKYQTRTTERDIQEAFKNPHSTFIHATPITNIVSEKIQKDGIFLDNCEYRMADEQIIYEIPLESVGLRMAKNRITRSKMDPWRRHGALVKLCEIGGSYPETKGRAKAQSFSYIRKGTQPPPPPKTNPLTSVDEYMTFKNPSSKTKTREW